MRALRLSMTPGASSILMSWIMEGEGSSAGLSKDVMMSEGAVDGCDEGYVGSLRKSMGDDGKNCLRNLGTKPGGAGFYRPMALRTKTLSHYFQPIIAVRCDSITADKSS